MNANVVIIGGGISGVAIAYNLAKKGMKDIVVFDDNYMTGGATGRCGAGVRQQWSSKGNCIMAKMSIDFFERAQEELEYHRDVEFKQEGYLIVATTDEEDEQFSKNVALQNEVGIPSKKLTLEEALQIVPHLNKKIVKSATFCPTDGHLNPFLMTDAYYTAAKKLGVQFFYRERVNEIVVKDGVIQKVITDHHEVLTSKVVNAAGGYSYEVGQMAGVDIPVYSENHEILVTEPIEKIQGPMVISFSKNIYCQQVPHGSFIMGRSNPNVEHNHDISSSHEFLDEMAKTAVELLPPLGQLRVIRQWGGSYNVSPDRQPILGDTDQLEGYYLACGFSGHGFMFAPMTGLLLSEIILNQPPTIDMSELHISRFKNSTHNTYEKSVV
ncbi:NAD(P)/FAD-dependent oxidoreductase [Candidatus Xianfuyuplasma coldseepsis]|uniref:FAD-binding oxidoreductase n=1 Tax=Candidatus Xianfuyuplasma coldseepsis TaxID=2782163 RepID=A0A7L7KRP4_9MOLU|nr:FAD-binding oxidoreductase [Xianfuyuplasma coldseepsis]QMS85500.1 FAD-binding oxidoreductase [Xianfuyuplasma coldseepsis]